MNIKVKIYYHHTDCGGVVYYANYLNFLEEARTEFLAQKGISVRDLAANDTLFVVARQEIDYKLPAFYQDTLEIETWISEISGVRLDFSSKITNQNNQTVSLAKTIMVCVGRDFKPKPIPQDIRKLFS